MRKVLPKQLCGTRPGPFRLVGLLVSGLVLLAGCSNTVPSPVATPPTLLVARGQQVFSERGCFISCHAVGALAANQQHPMVRNQPGAIPPDLTTAPPRSDDWLLAYLISPQAILPYSPMPSYSYVKDADLKALVAYLQSIKTIPTPLTLPLVDPQIVPSVPADLATYNAGRKVYQTYCQNCHGKGGNGNGPMGHLLSPEPRDFTNVNWLSRQSEVYLFSVVSYGKPRTAMPGFNDVLTLEQRSWVLNYIGYFADPIMKQRMELPPRASSESNER